MLADRMKNALQDFIHKDQNGFFYPRDNIRNVLNVLNYLEELNEKLL